MTGTRTTIRRERAAQATAPIALHALTGHIVDHGLPMPGIIYPPGIGSPNLEVWIRLDHLEAWLATGLELGEQVVVPVRREGLPEHRRITAPVQIPSGIGNVTVHLTWSEETPVSAFAHLRVVQR